MQQSSQQRLIAQGYAHAAFIDASSDYLVCGIARVSVARDGRLERDDAAVLAADDQLVKRAANTRIFTTLTHLCQEACLAPHQIDLVVCGVGPGSFTGVRIAVASAKGLASALNIPLCAVSTLDTVAHSLHQTGVRGQVMVLQDAMRKEVYPGAYRITDDEVLRLYTRECVEKATDFAEQMAHKQQSDGELWVIAGNAFEKYEHQLIEAGCTQLVDTQQAQPTTQGMLTAWLRTHATVDDIYHQRTHPAAIFPIYTRLSDAEEHERARLNLAPATPTMLQTGVADDVAGKDTQMRPMSIHDAPQAALLEQLVHDENQTQWSLLHFEDALRDVHGVWWMAHDAGELFAFAGGSLIDDAFEITNVAVSPHRQRQGVARRLLARLAGDAHALGATSMMLEVDVRNEAARSLYAQLGFVEEGRRAGYYRHADQRSDAILMRALLPLRDTYTPQLLGGDAGLCTVDGTQKRLDAVRRVPGDMHAQRADSSGAAVLAQGKVSTRELPGDDVSMVAASADDEHVLNDETAAIGVRESAAHEHPYIPASLCVHTNGLEDMDSQERVDIEARLAHRRPLILAVETSCDETAIAIIDKNNQLLANVVATQIDFHARFGGVVPEIASRKHTEALVGVYNEALMQAAAHLELPRFDGRLLDAVSVTQGPGLVGALVVGMAFAKGVAFAHQLPLIGVNHLEGHLFANLFEEPSLQPPFVASLVSGGHTMLVHVRQWHDYVVMGSTLDDAVGEAFDKVAKALGLGYPGGPIISKLAASGDDTAIDFPRAMLHSHDYRFSLSGLKTAVMNYIHQEEQAGRAINVPNLCASFQAAVVDVQVAKAVAAVEETGVDYFCAGGGVAANPVLRARLEEALSKRGVHVVLPPLSACTDNAAMIALVAQYLLSQRKTISFAADSMAHMPLKTREAYGVEEHGTI